MDAPRDWRDRETLLWPRGISVSPASMPVLALLRRGEVVATRQGGGPAFTIDAWLSDHLGPADTPVESVTSVERDALEAVAPLRARHLSARAGRIRADSTG